MLHPCDALTLFLAWFLFFQGACAQGHLSGSLSKSGPLHLGRKKIFPQTFLSELSCVISKCKDLSFLQMRQNNFFRVQNNHSRKTPKFERCKDAKLPKLTSSLLKDHQT